MAEEDLVNVPTIRVTGSAISLFAISCPHEAVLAGFPIGNYGNAISKESRSINHQFILCSMDHIIRGGEK